MAVLKKTQMIITTLEAGAESRRKGLIESITKIHEIL